MSPKGSMKYVIKYGVLVYIYICGRPTAVGIPTGYGQDAQGVGVRVAVGAEFVSSSLRPDRFKGPPSLLSNGYCGDISPGVMRLGCEADHSPRTSDEIKKTWIHTCTPPYVFMA
jgi:hypothetical protein